MKNYILIFILCLIVLVSNAQTANDYYMKGVKKSQANDYRGSIEDYTKAIDLEPNNKYYRERAFSKYFFDDNHGAIVDFTKAIKLDSTDELSYKYRGECKFYVADYRGAIVDFTKVIKLKPDLYGIANCYLLRGKCKANTEDYRGAIEDYNKAVKLEPDNSEIYINRGMAKFNLGMKNSGCLDFSKAGELGEKEAYKFITKHCNNKF